MNAFDSYKFQEPYFFYIDQDRVTELEKNIKEYVIYKK